MSFPNCEITFFAMTLVAVAACLTSFLSKTTNKSMTWARKTKKNVLTYFRISEFSTYRIGISFHFFKIVLFCFRLASVIQIFKLGKCQVTTTLFNKMRILFSVRKQMNFYVALSCVLKAMSAIYIYTNSFLWFRLENDESSYEVYFRCIQHHQTTKGASKGNFNI